MTLIYIILGLCVIVFILGYFIISGTKKNATITAENKVIVKDNDVQKEQLDVAAKSVSANDAYAGLKSGKKS